jgi:hypothetical protein
MSILEAALAAFLAVPGTTGNAPPAVSAAVPFSGSEFAHTIKADLESIAGKGAVSVSIDGPTVFSARIAMLGFNPKIGTQIYTRELELRQLYPGLNFDFYFDGPELARAIKADLESISGRGTVDVSIDSRNLFSIRIAVPGISSEIYSRILDRELEFYRAFRDLNFDFYLRPKQTEPVPAM